MQEQINLQGQLTLQYRLTQQNNISHIHTSSLPSHFAAFFIFLIDFFPQQ